MLPTSPPPPMMLTFMNHVSPASGPCPHPRGSPAPPPGPPPRPTAPPSRPAVPCPPRSCTACTHASSASGSGKPISRHFIRSWCVYPISTSLLPNHMTHLHRPRPVVHALGPER